MLLVLYGLAGGLVWCVIRAGPSEANAARRFGRLHVWLLLAAALPPGIATAFLAGEWKPLYRVLVGPFAGLLFWRHDFRDPDWSWSDGLGAIIVGLQPWAFGGLALALGAQWLISPRSAAPSKSRLALWAVGWVAWFFCGFWSIVAWLG